MDPQNNNSLKQSLMSLFANGNQTPVVPPQQPQVDEVVKVDQVDPVVPTPEPVVTPGESVVAPVVTDAPAPVVLPEVATAPQVDQVEPSEVETPLRQGFAGQEVDTKVEEVEQPALSEEQQERILRKTLGRIAEVMTNADMEEFEKIDSEDPSGNAGKYFLETRAPHYLDIMKEEVQSATT